MNVGLIYKGKSLSRPRSWSGSVSRSGSRSESVSRAGW